MSATDPRSRSILLVDDAEGTRFVYANWLRRAGYVVHEAATGTEAKELLGRTHFDIVLLDVNLPDMSGLDVCAHIKSTRRTAAVPVLHVSATATAPEDRSAGLNQGADGYLVEPVQRDELLATVVALLRYYDARQASERLAARLEQLHQATLLINAASSFTELIRYASSGATAIFGVPALVLVVQDGRGWLARSAPDELEASVRSCAPAVVTALAAAALAHEPLDLGLLDAKLGSDSPSGSQSSAIATPRGELVGTIVLLRDQIGSDDDLMLDHFSQAVAVALENQRLYAVEHQTALTLQHAMLPQFVPQPPFLDVAVCYRAASDTVEVGGDFYEVMVLDDNTTLLAIGDVEGHSLRAATVMAELRYSLRAFARLGLEARDIIHRLNMVLGDLDPYLSATVCIAEIDCPAREIRITNAGHVWPFVRAEGRGVFVEENGPLLPLGGANETPTVTVSFEPGALVVLVTDGLLERRGESIDVGFERLEAAVLAHGDDITTLCERLLTEVGAGEATFDDIAIVAARHRDTRPHRLVRVCSVVR